MIILLEGCDCSGKSELAKKLLKLIKAEYVHVSNPLTRNPFMEYVNLLKNIDVNKNYIFDRCFHGERAYGPVYRKKDGLSDEKQLYLEMLIMKHDPKLIYCWQGANELTWYFQTRGEDYTKLEDTPKLKKLYDETLKKSIIPVLRYRWSTDDFKMVKSFVKSRKRPTVDPNIKELYPDMIGYPTSKVLLIGDKKNSNLKENPVFCSTSGMFLMKTLKESKLTNVIIINSDKLKNSYLKKIKPTAVILLGKEASKRLNFNGQKFKTINHPQYAKRFYGKDALNIYSKKLMEAMR